MISGRKIIRVVFDIALICAALLLAFLLRFDFRVPVDEQALFWNCLAVFIIVKPLVFSSFGFYRSLWRYVSLQDAMAILKGVTLGSLISVFVILYLRQFAPVPRSVFILDWFLLVTMISASRIAWRIIQENCVIPQVTKGPRTLIIGAGDAGSLLLKEIRRQPVSSYTIIGFVDDDPEKQGMSLNGVSVLGTSLQLSALIAGYQIENVIIAMPSVSGRIVRTIIRRCKMAGVQLKTLPGISDIINGKISISQIKDVEIDDLLRREPVVIDEEAICRYLTGKKVLVTGAGGSIGSEICRQLAKFKPLELVLFDNAETPLFHIERELASHHEDLKIIPIIGDIRQREKVEGIFGELLPDVVFHAAAYKHVPMMEYNPVEAVTNNILGTKVLADTANKFGIANFVMISTDKAVNPTNVMGASKRAAEIYVQTLARRSSTCFSTVRFGNVLGSNGSVIPLFKEQIRKGGPVTVTDPQIIRYFMTIPEASQLVLQAGCIGNGGDIFVLDMGEPVPILELAEELIRLSGLVPYEDIDITFTGLRPGEKLFEELLLEGEGIRPTVHPKIKVLSAVAHDPEWVEQEVENLHGEAQANNISSIMALLCQLVPEFKPTHHFRGEPPPAFQTARPDLFPLNRRIIFNPISKRTH